jgi:hypothetical protein
MGARHDPAAVHDDHHHPAVAAIARSILCVTKEVMNLESFRTARGR